MALANAVPLRQRENVAVVTAGRALPVALPDTEAWTLLGIAGGRPLRLMGEWDGRAFAPLSAWGPDGAITWLRRSA